MGTRVAQNGRETSEMPGKFNFKNHVKKLTKECLRAFESNADSKIAPDSNPFEGIVKDGLENYKDDVNSNEYQQDLIDGMDSGVEVVRALSSNGSNSDRYTPAQSCGSSLLSCYSEPEGDRASECGSDNSKECRKAPDCGKKADRSRTGCKRGELSETCSENSSTCEGQPARISDLNRSNRLQGRKSDAKQPAARRGESSTRTASRDKSNARSQSTVRAAGHQTAEKPKIRPKPTCKLDDGRWPSAVQKSERPRPSHLGDAVRKTTNVMSSSVMTSSFKSPVENKSNALDKYGTLPRRPKRKSLENGEPTGNQALSLARSSSVSREPSLNRAATLRRQQSREKENIANGKSLPPYPKARRSTGKIVIYHEISIQTNVTGEDISSILAGRMPPDPIISPTVEKANKAIQSEGREKLKEMEEYYSKQSEELERERKENERLKLERSNMLLRICKMLGYSEPKVAGDGESEMNELERHFQAVGLTVIKQQEELSKLRHFKSVMQRDLEKSFAAQKNLLQQQQDIEAEYFELQEFLQAEKTALSESLNDTEAELERLRKEVSKKEELLKQQEEECKHLVRICEQRRQENLSLEAKLSGLEQRSRDVIVQQGAAVSGAAVALSGLGARLDSLVEQLATSCNISEKDLEVHRNEIRVNAH
ncbi:UNVERIFIED_CONTAM: hypothetical protein PYX00_005231 [Menopon gallinae]|uniref:Uncharacterized protein n=1 Tax=Menopon gallinae TaxID=328185 RepID=A0AAW2HQK9_9NEOP